MSRYKAYPEYRDSGVEWLGSIPLSWSAVSVKRQASIVNGATPKSDVADFWDGDIPWITPADLGKEKSPYIMSGARSITLDGYQSCGTDLVASGSVILSSRAPIGTLGIAAQELCTNQGCKSLIASKSLESKFLFYVLFSSTTQLNLLGRGTTFLELSADELGSYKISLPPPPDQRAIAAFLDHETAKIDALIEKQQRLIELLKEKRQAVISHAVTKGLNPSAPMKDSGVEWGDRVPTHWRVTKLSYHANVSNGATPSRENMLFWEGGTIAWLNSSKVNDEFIEEADQFITELALLKTSVKPVTKGDLVMAITGEGQTRGRVAICNIEATINQHLASISIYDKNLKYEFLYLWLEGNYERIRYESEGAGSTKGAITCSEIGSFPVLIPPVEEQDQIVSYVKQKKLNFDRLVRHAISANELMQERRTALISAAVTGKIDVRDWQAAA